MNLLNRLNALGPVLASSERTSAVWTQSKPVSNNPRYFRTDPKPVKTRSGHFLFSSFSRLQSHKTHQSGSVHVLLVSLQWFRQSMFPWERCCHPALDLQSKWISCWRTGRNRLHSRERFCDLQKSTRRLGWIWCDFALNWFNEMALWDSQVTLESKPTATWEFLNQPPHTQFWLKSAHQNGSIPTNPVECWLVLELVYVDVR